MGEQRCSPSEFQWRGEIVPEHIEHEVDARGAAYVILALDLAPFVKPESREKLEYIRGRTVFDNFVESLNLKGSCFELDSRYLEIEKQGYELEIFNHVLVKDNFAPTYHINKELVRFAPHLRTNVQFKNVFLHVWDSWDFWFRLTRNGVIVIVMKLVIPQRKALVHISKDVLGVQVPFDMESARKKLTELETGFAYAGEDVAAKMASVNEFMAWVNERSLVDAEQDRPAVVWQMAVEVIRQFIQACNSHLHYDAPDGFDIDLTSEIERGVSNPLRERYTVFHFEEMTQYDRKSKKHNLIAPRNVLGNLDYVRSLSALLEGIILEGHSKEEGGERSLFYPVHSTIAANQLANCDCSSWEDEFCIITQRGTAIYSIPYEGHRVIFPSRRIQYSDYWQCIIRGLEFTVETKVLAQVAERATSELLDEALPMLRGNQMQGDPRRLQKFGDDVSNSARLMAHLRTITVPQLISRASYAIAKFELFNRQAGIEKILDHAEANVTDLTELIERYYDLELQIESQRSNEVALGISIIFASLTLNLGILSLPSFIQDWDTQGQIQGYLSKQFYYPILPIAGELLVLFLIFVSAVALTLGIQNLFRARRRRKEQIW